MVFVNHIVAVHGVALQEVAEAQEDLDLLVEPQARHILAAALHQRWLPAVARQDLEFFKVNVDGVLPAPGAVPQYPDLSSPLDRRGADSIVVEEFAVDGPLAVCSVKLPRPDPRACQLGTG